MAAAATRKDAFLFLKFSGNEVQIWWDSDWTFLGRSSLVANRSRYSFGFGLGTFRFSSLISTFLFLLSAWMASFFSEPVRFCSAFAISFSARGILRILATMNMRAARTFQVSLPGVIFLDLAFLKSALTSAFTAFGRKRSSHNLSRLIRAWRRLLSR